MSVDKVERLFPDERLLQDIGPWIFHDAGGTGDCGYRLSCCMLSLLP